MHEALETEYARRRVSVLVPLAKELEKFLIECMNGVPRIDRISARAKAVDSFMGKATKTIVGKPKYNDPLNEIQDQVGARIVTYYASDVPRIEAIVKRYFRAIESTPRVPESQWTFGYFGYHDILVIPSDVIDGAWNPSHTPRFFELQIKTLFQHAWAEAGHDLGYKPGDELLAPDQERKLAFTSAQAWGADQYFDELWKARNGISSESAASTETSTS
jgi:putative GTP pyrophosphokinase